MILVVFGLAEVLSYLITSFSGLISGSSIFTLASSHSKA